MAKTTQSVKVAWISAAAVVVAAIIGVLRYSSGGNGGVAVTGGGAGVQVQGSSGTSITISDGGKTRVAGKLEVVDILVDSYRKDLSCRVDFRVVNRGGQPVSLSRIRFKAVLIEEATSKGALAFSSKYDLDISDLRHVGDTKEIAISHNVEPGETDRFAVDLAAQNLKSGEFRIWELAPTFVTSEGEVTGKSFRVALPWDIAKSKVNPTLSSGNEPGTK